MAVKQMFLDFRVPEESLEDEAVMQELFQTLRKFNAKGPVVSTNLSEGNDRQYLYIFTGENKCQWTVRTFQDGLITLDIMQPVSKDDKSEGMDCEEREDLEKELSKVLSSKTSQAYCSSIIRGASIHRYYSTMDDLFIEYDFDKAVYEEDSKYQNIKILHSKQFGNVLILDDDINIAESDIVYTKVILGNGREDYKDKTVLILGGGDGGILHELLNHHSPKYITMVEIDKLVLECAAKHLRGICGDSLDSLTGPKYQVLVEDCVKVMETCCREGTVFDYIINDLTAIPISTQPRGSEWDFMRLILDLSMKVLSPKGKYFTQGNGANCSDALKMYEDQLGKLECTVLFNSETIFVPSYHEMWVFYEIWKKEESPGNFEIRDCMLENPTTGAT